MTVKPYDAYVTRVLAGDYLADNRCTYPSDPVEPEWYTLPKSKLRMLLTEAWFAGLSHSLELIEGEKETRNGRS